MIKKLLVIVFFFHYSSLNAQTIKTDVLIIGNSAGGFAAAIQSARSKAKTLLATQPATNVGFPADQDEIVRINNNENSGIWAEFRDSLKNFYKNTAGLNITENNSCRLNTKIIPLILKKIIDSTKNLNIFSNASFAGIKRNGAFWEVKLNQDDKSFKVLARVVIDATLNREVITKEGTVSVTTSDLFEESVGPKKYRTSIAAGNSSSGKTHSTNNNYPPYPIWCIPISALALKGADNLLAAEPADIEKKDISFLPLQLGLGQGIGATAAYCAFFKTTTKNLNVRTIQGELLDFKVNLLPFDDVPVTNENWRAIQQVSATGLLRGVPSGYDNNFQFLFKPDSTVSTDEIKPVLTEIYTRAFLWLSKEKLSEKFTLGNLLSFISDYTLTDPRVLTGNVQKAWKAQYKFKNSFDINSQINRLEFAVLANRYLNPFSRTIDLEGRLMN